jgi:RNA polymerase sigma factor (sigma-70 family)
MDRSSELECWIGRLKAGDASARENLLNCAQERLRKLAWKMLKGFPGVARWEDLEDVTQEAALKLWRALREVTPGSVREFIGLAAAQIRRVLIDLARHYFGPQGAGRKHHSPHPDDGTAPDVADSTHDQKKLAAWTDFHEHIAALPDKEREVFELHWYQGLTHQETANLLGVSQDTIKRRWQSARLLLYQALDGELPEL